MPIALVHLFLPSRGQRTYNYSATRTVDHSILAQELPSVGVQGSGVSDPRFSWFVYSLVVCEMGVRRALGSSVHRPTPDAERQISPVGLHSINTGVCVPLHYIESRREITSEQ